MVLFALPVGKAWHRQSPVRSLEVIPDSDSPLPEHKHRVVHNFSEQVYIGKQGNW